MASARLSSRAWTQMFLLIAMVITPLWVSPTGVGIPGSVSFLVLMLIVARAPMPEETAEPEPIVGAGMLEGAAVAALLMAPAVIFLVLTWRQEFPWLGDHDYHLQQSLVSLTFWRRWFLPAIALIAVAAVATRRSSRSLVPVIACAAVVLAGWIMTRGIFVLQRYPRTFYFLAAPAGALASALAWQSPLNALRLTNVLSLPVWLFVLRPLIVRRWPDRSLLPFGCFLFLQKDLVYYFASPYLEPWALILIAVAVERLVRFGPREAWRAWLLAGMAAVIKEQAILILPFIVLPTISWRDRSKRSEQILTVIAAGAPFVLYYLIRSAAAVWRTAGLVSWSEMANDERLRQFAHRLLLQFNVSLIALSAAAVLCLWLAVAGPRERRPIFAGLLAAAAFQIVFFYTDRISLFWTGYPRFHFFPMVLLASAFLWVGAQLRSQRSAIAVAGVLAVLNAVSLIPALELAAGPDQRRNFSEHLDAPIYYPVRRLLSAAAGVAAFHGVREVRFLHNAEELLPGSIRAGYRPGRNYELDMPSAYPDLARRFSMKSEAFADDGASRCQCRNDQEAAAGLFVFFTGLGEENPARVAMQRQSAVCRESLARTCRTTLALADRGQVIGVIGIGLRPQLAPEALQKSPAGR